MIVKGTSYVDRKMARLPVLCLVWVKNGRPLKSNLNGTCSVHDLKRNVMCMTSQRGHSKTNEMHLYSTSNIQNVEVRQDISNFQYFIWFARYLILQHGQKNEYLSENGVTCVKMHCDSLCRIPAMDIYLYSTNLVRKTGCLKTNHSINWFSAKQKFYITI